jgi:hypothetical protein
MLTQRAKLTVTSLVALLYCTTTLAQAQHEQEVCPSIEKIHQMAPYMTDATPMLGHTYQVYASTKLMDNGKPWEIIATLVIAESRQVASKLAQERSSKVTDAVYNVAKSLFGSGGGSCIYYEKTGKTPIVTIMAEPA